IVAWGRPRSDSSPSTLPVRPLPHTGNLGVPRVCRSASRQNTDPGAQGDATAALFRLALGESATPDESVGRAYPRIGEAAAFRDLGANRQWSSAVAHRILWLDCLWQRAAESASSKSLFPRCGGAKRYVRCNGQDYLVRVFA